MDNDGKDTKHTRHIYKIIYFVRNVEEWNLYKTVWCEVGLNLAYIGNKNVREDEFYHILGYSMVILEIL